MLESFEEGFDREEEDSFIDSLDNNLLEDNVDVAAYSLEVDFSASFFDRCVKMSNS